MNDNVYFYMNTSYRVNFGPQNLSLVPDWILCGRLDVKQKVHYSLRLNNERSAVSPDLSAT